MSCDERGSTVTYNGIPIYDVLTDEINQEVVYEPTGVDPIGIRVTATFTGYVHMSAQEKFGHRLTGALASDMQIVERALLTPRRVFTMTIGGQTWLSCAPYAVERCSNYPSGISGSPSHSGYWDIENGPRPSLRIIGIVGDRSMKVKFGIQYTRSICEDPSAAAMFKGLMNLRMWIVDDIDCSNFMVTRTYQGRIRFYGPISTVNGMPVHKNLLARAFAIPPLQWGFQRKRIMINEDPGGLMADFQITDQEVWAVAPAPATDWEGTFEVTIPYGGLTCESECRVTVKGGKMTPKWHLLRLAMKILDAKLRLSDANAKYIPMATSFSEPLNANEVTGYCRVKHLGETKFTGPVLGLNVFAANSATWFKPFPIAGPGSLDLTGLAPGTHNPYQFEHGYQGSSPDGAQTVMWAPNSLVGLLIPSLQTPCCPVWMTNNVTAYAPSPVSLYTVGGQDHPESSTETQVSTSPGPLPDSSNSQSAQQKEAFYWQTRLTSEYKTDNGIAAFPRAVKDGDNKTLSLARLHAPCQFREFRFEFVRAGAWPEIPKPKEQFDGENGNKHTLLRWKLAPNGASLAADGKQDIRSCAMIMLYALDRPVDWENQEKFPVGRLPDREPTDHGFQELNPAIVAPQLFVDPVTIIGVT